MAPKAQKPVLTALTDDARQKLMALAYAADRMHRNHSGHVEAVAGCYYCEAIAGGLKVLDMDVRRRGPEFEEELAVLPAEQRSGR